MVRPKYALWLLVAVVSSGWYMIDPQAKDASAAVGRAAGADGEQLAVVRPGTDAVTHSPPRVAASTSL